MTDVDLTQYENVDLTSLSQDEARDVIRAIARDVQRESNERYTARRAPKPEPVEENSAHAEAVAALEAERQRVSDVEAARALIRKRAVEAGYTVTTEGMSDQEALQRAGLAPPPPETPEQRRIREEDEIWREGGARLAELERRKQIDRLDQRWFQLAGWERKREAERLGLDYKDCEAQMQQRYANRRTY